jgi:rSAM/selenodomain-associated transferase 1
MRRAILLFVKFPEPGKVKTRLAATVGPHAATEIYRQLVAAVCAHLPKEGEEVVVMFDPEEQRAETEAWVRPQIDGAVSFVPQSDGDLGRRLDIAFADAFSAGCQRVLAIGSDCIELTPEIFREAWDALETDDVVLGPVSDGGYYLIALKAAHPALFSGIAWSTDAVLAQTERAAAASRLSVYRLPALHDVDTEDDWRRAQSRLNP